MHLSSFVLAKVASLPLMTLYAFIGASAGTLITDTEAIENNSTLIVSGLVLSVIMIVSITHYIKRELNKVRMLMSSFSNFVVVSATLTTLVTGASFASS
jgi:energy-converting hydrogenase Eha subunit H